ncbi:MAG: aspartate--tRNA ligase [Chlamydiae bacterium]|nr:aspartate--tRNA ligase [Chlamydiota bacterium]MBI3266988.1 aspartate--tRNA ligase [Chlamydiota bacterium]
MSLRTHTCGELRKNNVGETIALCGWVGSRRDHGGLVFIDLRDRYGVTQVVFNPKVHPQAYEVSKDLRPEFVISIKGQVSERPSGTTNSKLPTGEIEVSAEVLEILNPSQTPPFEIQDEVEVSEDIRLKYRYLDLRRPFMQRNLLNRYRISKIARDYLDKQNFLEVETPMLTKSTPEGARDYLVPSRIFPGKFFALPQSPQLFKQLLMVSGYDRYYQLTRCFRDEDLRADRQPEHTQIDIEMSFIDEEDVFKLIEGLLSEVFKGVLNLELKMPLPRLTYEEATSRFGSDKPDLRYDFKLVDLTNWAKTVEFKIFRETAEKGGKVKAINAKKGASFSLKDIEDLTEFVKSLGAKGLAWMKYEESGEWKSPIVKFFLTTNLAELKNQMKAEPEDLILFVADKKEVVHSTLGPLRLKVVEKLGIKPKTDFALLWVVDFPLLEYSEEEKKFVAVHHPFTSPKKEDIALLDKEPLKARAKAYDLVINGTEAGGGSIRIHSQDLQKRMFNLLGINDQDAQVKFGFLLEAFKHGAPPHGGIALGLDRLTMLLLGLKSIRDTIAFPKTQSSSCLMTESPSEVSERQLKELHLNKGRE